MYNAFELNQIISILLVANLVYDEISMIMEPEQTDVQDVSFIRSWRIWFTISNQYMGIFRGDPTDLSKPQLKKGAHYKKSLTSHA